MTVEELRQLVGQQVKILPEPEHRNAHGVYVQIFPNEWRVETFQEKALELKNLQTGHTVVLGYAQVSNIRDNALRLRFKPILKGKRTVF
jgi:hypothetical protein